MAKKELTQEQVKDILESDDPNVAMFERFYNAGVKHARIESFTKEDLKSFGISLGLTDETADGLIELWLKERNA